LVDVQLIGVLDSMPSAGLKPENDEEALEEDRNYRTTCMCSTMRTQARTLSGHTACSDFLARLAHVPCTNTHLAHLGRILEPKLPDCLRSMSSRWVMVTSLCIPQLLVPRIIFESENPVINRLSVIKAL
jgi:hypothetical protein